MSTPDRGVHVNVARIRPTGNVSYGPLAKDKSKKILRELEALRGNLTARLDRIEAALARQSSVEPASAPTPLKRVDLPETAPDPVAAPADLSTLPDGEIRVIVTPLRDLSLARAVESSLAQSDGIERATLRELRGDSAMIDVQAVDGVSVLGSLRRHLPVAFDVTGTDARSVTIALAQPGAEGAGGVAAPGNS